MFTVSEEGFNTSHFHGTLSQARAVKSVRGEGAACSGVVQKGEQKTHLAECDSARSIHGTHGWLSALKL